MCTKTRLSTYATLAAAGTGAVVGAADAAIISSTALNGTVIKWNATPTTSTNIPVAGGPGFRVNTRATAAGGGSTASGYVGVVIAGIGGGNVSFLRGGAGTNGIQLAGYGAKATTAGGTGWSAFGNINVGNSLANAGNPAFSGTSKYVMFRFTNAGTTNYGWIELKAATTGFSGTSQYSVTLGDWAYDNSGAVLGAGVTGSAVPGLGGLAALAAMGAAGVRTRRQR
ncbi:MAG: hypothetical protein ACO3NL_12580 [Phycisphaerales bacterium]